MISSNPKERWALASIYPCHLFSASISAHRNCRPAIGEVLLHPFFWPAHKRLLFLKDASDYLEPEPIYHPLVKALEVSHMQLFAFFCDCDQSCTCICAYICAFALLSSPLQARSRYIVDSDWSARLHPDIIENIGKYRRYMYDSVRDLLRVIRNKSHHYRDLPEPVQSIGYLQTTELLIELAYV